MTEEFKEKLLSYDEPFTLHNGIRFTDFADGYARAEADVTADSLNHWGGPHGGMLFTMIDIACGASVVTLRQESCVTVASNINFIAAAKEGDHLIAEGRVRKQGGHMTFCDAEIHDGAGRLLATATSTMYFTGRKLFA
jgi:uncharacterized protein (TIGR00369 family)